MRYLDGGVTPGDEYLWFVDKDGLPTGFKMWVKIIPIGGVYASWQNWITLKGGARIATEHHLSIGGLVLKITDIRSGFSWEELGYNENPISL